MSSSPFVVHWGIVGCGWISSEFVKDISIQREDVKDVYHAIAAVGSRDIEKAREFVKKYCPLGANGQQKHLTTASVECHGSYEAVYHHERVDAVYIGSPNQSHYTDAFNAIQAGKHCLVEKPACLNAAEWKHLSMMASERKLFLMEAVWSRFLPMTDILLSKLHEERAIGDLKVIQSDFSMPFYNKLPDTHRCLSMDYAGGPWYDLGPYILLAPLLLLYRDPNNELTRPSKVTGHMLKARTGVDLSTTVTLSFDRLEAVAIGTTSFAYASNSETKVTVIGTRGELIVHDGPNRWTKVTLRRLDPASKDPGAPIYLPGEVIERPFVGFGLMFEADAVARSLKNGDLQNARMTHDDTALQLEIINQVQADGDYILPAGLAKR